MTTCVSLFRGINVGGNHIVPMRELKAFHESLGLKDVVTYIQSGNVIFTSDETDTDQLSRRIEEGFAERFGFRSSVAVRTLSELNAIVTKNPFQNQPLLESKALLVLFLVAPPISTAQEDLQSVYSGPEEFHVLGQEIYIYYSTGMGRSKLTVPLIEKAIKTGGTGRNWNTVLKLQTMLQR